MKYLILLFLIIGIISCNTEHKPKSKEELVKFDEPLMKINKFLVKEDADRINAYIQRRNWNMQTTETGLFYMIYESGKGEKATEGKIATINFTVELLDGTLCYSSDSLGSKRFRIGQGGVESGLEQGLLLLREGDKARFIMPPYMAHGLLGDQLKIPPRSIIVYQVEVLKIGEY